MAKGPIPKRSSELLGHRSKAFHASIDHPAGTAKLHVPEPDPSWTDEAIAWYVALFESGQAIYFEPSDVQQARLLAEAMTRNSRAEVINAALLKTILSGMDGLLTTEGARRRAGIELERPAPAGEDDEDGPEGVTTMSSYRARLQG